MFNKIINSIKEGTFFERVLARIERVKYKHYVKKFSNDSLDDKKVIFITFQGKYTCNPKYICEEFLKRKTDYKLIWEIDKKEDKSLYPEELELVTRGTKEFFKEVSSAKYIVVNANDLSYLCYKKKEGQVIFQTWHGSLGFKKIDPSSVKNEHWVSKSISFNKSVDYVISNSKFEDMVYRTSYWPETKILDFGHARNDILLDSEKSKIVNKKVREFYNIDSDTKIALYAPTFRDDFSYENYEIDYEKFKAALEKRFGGKWIIMVRFHHKLKNVKFKNTNTDYVINVTNYYDIQELLCAANIGLTDYSSWLCDYVLTDKPGFLYMKDMDKYVDERGFYYPLSETPFPISKSEEELFDSIINFNEEEYEKKRIEFLEKRGSYEKGTASVSVVDLIIKGE